MSKNLPSEITSYDLYKTLAIIIMVVDHIGAYIYPENVWWRAFGNSPAIWVVLIGYARSRTISAKLIGGAALLTLLDVIIGDHIFPLNILATVIVIRLTLDKVADIALFKNQSVFWLSVLCLCILWVPTANIFDYGTFAILLALYGFALRHKENLLRAQDIERMLFVCFGVYVFTQYISYDFTTHQFVLMAVTTFIMISMMPFFKPATYPGLTALLPSFVIWIVHICGRRTLEFYVVHVIVFKVLAFYLGTKGYAFFEWSFFYEESAQSPLPS